MTTTATPARSREQLGPKPLKSVFNDDQFTTYDTEISFEGTLLGGIPKDPKIIGSWMKRNLGAAPDEVLRQRLLETVQSLGHDTTELAKEQDVEKLNEAITELVGEVKTVGFRKNHDVYMTRLGPNLRTICRTAVASPM